MTIDLSFAILQERCTVPWLVTVKLEIRPQRSRSKKDSRSRLSEEQRRDSSTREELSTLIQTTRERRVPTLALARKPSEYGRSSAILSEHQIHFLRLNTTYSCLRNLISPMPLAQGYLIVFYLFFLFQILKL